MFIYTYCNIKHVGTICRFFSKAIKFCEYSIFNSANFNHNISLCVIENRNILVISCNRTDFPPVQLNSKKINFWITSNGLKFQFLGIKNVKITSNRHIYLIYIRQVQILPKMSLKDSRSKLGQCTYNNFNLQKRVKGLKF